MSTEKIKKELVWIRQFIHKKDDENVVIRDVNGKDIASWIDRVDAAIATPPAAQPAPEDYTALEQALTRMQKRYFELRAKVAAQQEPVAFIAPNGDLRKTTEAKDHWEWGAEFTPLYTTPPAAPVHDQLAWKNLRNRIKADIDRTEGRWGMHGHSAVDNDYFTALEWVVERMDEILASTHCKPLIDVQWLEDAYLAGFMNSDEGHNGEYPFRYREENPLEDRRWLEAKNAYISAAIAAAKGEA